jgi:hypothetical protein
MPTVRNRVVAAAAALLVALTTPGVVAAPPPAHHEVESTAAAAPVGGAAKKMLERLAALSGSWAGTFSWSGARSGAGNLTAVYQTTGNGSAVVETLLMGGSPSMTSVYHLDGDALRATHFCAAGNQPRLRAVRLDQQAGTVDFTLVDITNLVDPAAGHVKQLRLKVGDPDRVEIEFEFGSATGPPAVETIRLQRVVAPAPAGP